MNNIHFQINLYSQTFVMPNTPNVNMNWTTMLMNMEKLYNDMTMMNMPNDEQLQYSVNKIMNEMGLNMTAVSQQLMQMLNSLDMTSMTADRSVCLLRFNITFKHIATVPACSSGTLTNVLPHRNGMLQTQDMTSHPNVV